VRSLVVAALALCALPVAAQETVLKGAVAYTEILRYDYTGDGKRNRVRFWLEFDARSAQGSPGQPGYQPAAGTLRYFLRDEDDGTKVVKWRQGLDMAGVPRDQPFPMTDIEFDGKSVRFEAFGMRWAVTDGGEGFEQDRIIVNDGFRTSEVTKLYAGNVWVGPAKQ
jgi:hypothetical protein